MPYVNCKLVGSLTKEQKKEIAKQFSETLEKVAKKGKKHTYITFEEVKGENWAIGDELLG